MSSLKRRAWSKKIKNKKFFFKKVCQNFPKKYKFINKKISLSLLLSNNKCIKKLNKDFRNKNKATDILSFPLMKKKRYLSKPILETLSLAMTLLINLNLKTQKFLNKN